MYHVSHESLLCHNIVHVVQYVVVVFSDVYKTQCVYCLIDALSLVTSH